MARQTADDFVESQVAHYLVLSVSPLLMLFGLAGNVISFCIFYPKAVKSKNRSSYTFLTVLAVFDSLALMTSAGRGFLTHAFHFDIVLALHCGYFLFVNYLCTDMAFYVIICMTVGRAINVLLPFKAKVYCTRNRALLFMGVVFVILVGINCPISFTSRPVQQQITESNVTTSQLVCGAPEQFVHFLNFVWPWVDLTVLSFLPCVLLTGLNCAILLRMRRQLKRVHAMGEVSDERTASQKRTNILLLSICVVFLVCTTPLTILHIVEPYWSRDNDPHQEAIHALLTTVTLQLLFLNNCLNFMLYCLSGREFRKDLKRMFRRQGDSTDSINATGLA